MKKYLILFIIVSSVVFSSCDNGASSEVNDQVAKSQILERGLMKVQEFPEGTQAMEFGTHEELLEYLEKRDKAIEEFSKSLKESKIPSSNDSGNNLELPDLALKSSSYHWYVDYFAEIPYGWFLQLRIRCKFTSSMGDWYGTLSTSFSGYKFGVGWKHMDGHCTVISDIYHPYYHVYFDGSGQELYLVGGYEAYALNAYFTGRGTLCGELFEFSYYDCTGAEVTN